MKPKIEIEAGKIKVMMDFTNKYTWSGIYDYLNLNKNLKEEGWRLPSVNESYYINCLYNLNIIGVPDNKREFWTSEVYDKDSNGDPEVCISYILASSRWIDRERASINAAGIREIKLPLVLVKDLI
jgi:hypothetical protein